MAEKNTNPHWAKDTEEEDRVESLIRRSGCWDNHMGVVECMSEKGDWRQCQTQLTSFKECMMKAQPQQYDKSKK
ncbi:unnamed protein product [Auanema sp. JU1783]|nr:unnamed protein product [Auanema sp. JU1783]